MQKKDTLVIIGNGFDIWQNLNTRYTDFQKYYLNHKKEILKKLKIKEKILKQKDGSIFRFSDVELIYGNPFRPLDFNKDFWYTFETSLGKIDAHRLNLFFGKDKKGLKAMAKSVVNANRILKEAFCSWIATIQIAKIDSGLNFDENCFFINFNYTKTLEKRFGVKKADIMHIHGEADDAESIVVGHATHPQEPENALYQLGGRFRGLFLVDYILYQTDKHVRDNITMLCLEFALAGIHPADIKDVYVLGHSLGDADIEYFEFLGEAVSGKTTDEEILADLVSNERDPLDELNNRIQYIIKTYGKDPTIIDTVTQEEKSAIHRKFLREQQERDAAIEEVFSKKLSNGGKKRRCKLSNSGTRVHRKSDALKEDRQKIHVNRNSIRSGRISDARWHITYYSDADKKRAQTLMNKLGTDYELLGSIDEAVEKIRRK